MNKQDSTAFDKWVGDMVSSLGGNPDAIQGSIKPLVTGPDYTKRMRALICGVYFLMDQEEVVYIGQSLNVYSRIGVHVRNDSLKFTHFVVNECDPEDRWSLEAKFIREFDPIGNKFIPSHEELRGFRRAMEKQQ